MSVILGSGEFQYRAEDSWAKLPDGWTFGDVAAVAVNSRDEVFAFTRGLHPIIVFDRDGNFLRSWGEGVFERPHGLHIGIDDSVWCTDDGDHTVRKFSPDGKQLLLVGTPNKPSAYMQGQPFNRCTHTAESPEGDIYVSDGYGNASVHKYSPDGKLLLSWGEPGIEPGQFNMPHNICCDHDGWVYVADRENHRVQVFDKNGRFETQWHGIHRPCAMCMAAAAAADGLCYVAEIGPEMPINRHVPNLGPRISILKNTGELVARVADTGRGTEPGQLIAPHGLAVDRHGDLYVSELPYVAWPRLFDTPQPATLTSLRKLVRLRS